MQKLKESRPRRRLGGAKRFFFPTTGWLFVIVIGGPHRMPELCTNYTCLACRHAQPVSVPIRSDLAASKPLLPRENTANVSSLFIAQARKRFVCGFLYIGQYTVIREVRLFLFFFCCLGESRFLSAIQSPPIFSILQAYFRAHFCGEEEFTSFTASKKKKTKKKTHACYMYM